MSDDTCIHCGADCGKDPHIFGMEKFCCTGCKQVYQLLNENQLHQYYTFDKTPGVRISEPDHHGKYAFLDKEEVKQKLYEFLEGNSAGLTFYIPSIHCVSCIWLLEHLSRLNSGIKQSSVNFVRKEVTVSFNTNEVSLREVVELLASIHYIPDISLKTLEKKVIHSVDRTLFYKIGVAGFIFGNVMMYSLPEYFNGKPLGEFLGTFLHYISFILALPLVLYSGSDYIISAAKNLRKGIINIDLPIAMGILALFFMTGYEVFSSRGPGYSDTLAGFLFFLLIGKWYQSKTYQSLSFDRDYKSYFPVAVTKMTDGKQVSTLLEEIVAGDILLLRSKELIPTDGTLIEGSAFIDYSFVTGESVPVKKVPGDVIYAGGIQTSGAITIKVEREVKQSHLTQLWNQNESVKSDHQSLTSMIDRISVFFTITIIFVALSGFAGWMFIGNFRTALLVFTSVLIVACPCALAMSLPFTLGTAMRILGSNGMYLKNIRVIEKLTRIDTMVFDKTGTLTKPDENEIQFIGTPLTESETRAVKSLVQQSTHPLSQVLDRYLNEVKPFITNGFVEMSGKGIYAKADSKPVKIGSRNFVCEEKEEDLNQLSSCVYLSIDEIFKGYFVVSNKYRPGFGEVIPKLAKSYDMFLLSGDNEAEKEHLEQYFEADKIFFNQRPEQKKDFVASLRKQGKTVMMTGDGLNDSGAFMQSDVALSIADDIYHFSPAGDAIIEASRFQNLTSYISFAQKSILIVKLSFGISFLYNIIGLAIALTGNLSPVVAAILMPASSVTVVAFSTFATRLLARQVIHK